MTIRFMKSRVATFLAAVAACAVLAGCTTGPHPPANQPAVDGKDSGKIKATTTGPHPSSSSQK